MKMLFMERQGKPGQRTLVRARNRVGGYSERYHSDYGQEVLKRRRLAERSLSLLIDDQVDEALDSERVCAITGEPLPSGGGIVSLDLSESYMMLRYDSEGRLVGATCE
jgi:ribosomal protein L34